MSDEQITPQGETEVAGTTEPQATEQATGSEAPQAPEVPQEQSPVDAEALQREKDKIAQERNLLRNKLEKYEQEKEEARQAQLSENERLAEELEELRAEKALREARDFRNQVIDSYPDEAVRKAARALIQKNESNLVWGDNATEEEAKAQVYEQLDALKAVIPTGAPEQTETGSTVHPNNPNTNTQEPELDWDTQVQSAAKSRDFSAVLKQIPSVQEQLKKLEE